MNRPMDGNFPTPSQNTSSLLCHPLDIILAPTNPCPGNLFTYLSRIHPPISHLHSHISSPLPQLPPISKLPKVYHQPSPLPKFPCPKRKPSKRPQTETPVPRQQPTNMHFVPTAHIRIRKCFRRLIGSSCSPSPFLFGGLLPSSSHSSSFLPNPSFLPYPSHLRPHLHLCIRSRIGTPVKAPKTPSPTPSPVA